MNNTLNIFSKYWFWLFAIVVLILYDLTPRIDGFDTYYYFLAGEHYWNGQLDCLRTPVYPLICKSFSLLFGLKGMAVALTIFQSLVYLLSLLSLQRLATRAINNTKIRFAILLFYVCCIAPGWCNEITTESLSISGTIILSDLLFCFLERPSFKLNISIHLLLLSLLFLRPTFVLFLVLIPVLLLSRLRFSSHRKSIFLALSLSILCFLCFGGYASLYKKYFGIYGTTTTFVFNKIYDSHRGGYWDPDAVVRSECRRWIDSIDHKYTNNYGVVYNTIMQHPKSLPLINEGCNDIKHTHKAEHRLYRIKLFIGSFDKRFLAAVNTHTPLSAILFTTTLFLSFPLSLFYLFTLVTSIALLYFFFKSKRPSLLYAYLTIAIFAHTLGIAITTSDSFERLLLPVYPLFLILLGIATEKAIKLFKHK